MDPSSRIIPRIALAILLTAAAWPGESPARDQDPLDPPGQLDLAQLQGVFAAQQILSARVQIPALGERDGLITLIQRVEIDQDGDQLSLQFVTCDLIMDSGTPFLSLIIPPTFIEALEPFLRTAVLSDERDQTRLFAPQAVELYGVALEDPENDPLPEDPEDPAVLDPDQDGNPGLTLEVSGLLKGHMYLIQRLVS